jgi:hypothetical protein
MSNDKKVETMVENGLSQLVILEGKAPEQHNAQPVIIRGNIDAPSRFLEGKISEFEYSKSHCMVSKTDGIIMLVLNEQSVVDKYTVIGEISVSKKFNSLGINNDKVRYEPEELANKLKLLRSMFVSKMEHASICNILRNLKAKINAQIESLDDRKGNVTENFKQTVSSNMPDSIKLKLPLLEGEEPIEIEVNVILEANGGSGIICSLESVDAAELIEFQFEQRVNQEVDKIKDKVTIIEF